MNITTDELLRELERRHFKLIVVPSKGCLQGIKREICKKCWGLRLESGWDTKDSDKQWRCAYGGVGVMENGLIPGDCRYKLEHLILDNDTKD